MSTYILLANFTDQGIRNIKGSPARAEAARELAQSFDVKFKEFYATLGGYDLVAILEAGRDDAVTKFVLALGAAGNVRTTTLKAFTESEYKDIVQALP